MSGVQVYLQHIERGIAHAQSRLLSKEELLALLRSNLEAINNTLGGVGRVEAAETRMVDAIEKLLAAQNPAADEMRDQEAEDRGYQDVVTAFEAYRDAVGQAAGAAGR